MTSQKNFLQQSRINYTLQLQVKLQLKLLRIGLIVKKTNIGLTNWKNGPKGKIRETDVIIAKNYLNEVELDNLNRIVTMYLDYADMQAREKHIMYMSD